MSNPLPIVLSLLLLVTGCVSMKPVLPKETTFDLPQLNQITEKELGDTLIDKGRIRSYPAIVTVEPTEAHWGLGGTMRADPGMFVAVGTTDFGTVYRALTPIRWTAPLGSGFGEGGVVVPHASTNQPHLFVTVGPETRNSYRLKNFACKETTANQLLPGSFRQELIYNGRSGDAIKFLYREVNDSFVRTPFSQDVTYDLKDGNVIGFKGARLKILDANNTKIRYEVSKTFDR